MTGRTKSWKIISDNYIHNNNFLCFLTPVQYKRGQSRDPVDWTVTLVLNPTTRHALTQCISSSLPSDQCLSPTFLAPSIGLPIPKCLRSFLPSIFLSYCLPQTFFYVQCVFSFIFLFVRLFCFFFPFYDFLLLYSYTTPTPYMHTSDLIFHLPPRNEVTLPFYNVINKFPGAFLSLATHFLLSFNNPLKPSSSFPLYLFLALSSLSPRPFHTLLIFPSKYMHSNEVDSRKIATSRQSLSKYPKPQSFNRRVGCFLMLSRTWNINQYNFLLFFY